MARGIHLKQLTLKNLERLGLPRDPSGPVSADQGPLGPAQAAEGTARLPRWRNPPPDNPVSAKRKSGAAEPALGRRPLDLRAVARELCLDLEMTLRLLEGSAPD